MIYRWVFAILILCLVTTPSTASAKDPREVFATHDPNGRLPNTNIEKLGMLQVEGVSYSIYYLTFVNPESRHGQHRTAIIRNGNEFSGAYQC